MFYLQLIKLVEPGHVGLKFSRISGLKDTPYREGWHLRIPYFERPIIFNT
jgi:prohibitin 2